MKIQVITDSTCDLPVTVYKELNIEVVPIYLRFGDKTYRDGVDITKEEFYTLLSTSLIHPATSQPNPEDFAAVYRENCRNSDGIISIHVSSKISGTYNSATMACKAVKSQCPIVVIDSGFNSAGLGLITLAAARKAKAGASLNEIVEEVQKAIGQVRMFGLFETMKYLARSGRVNKTIAAASDFIKVVPLLTFHEGEIIRAGLARTVNRGMDRICDFVARNLPVSELTVVHSAIEDRAMEFRERLQKLTSRTDIPLVQLGAGLGVHGGPGVLLAALRAG